MRAVNVDMSLTFYGNIEKLHTQRKLAKVKSIKTKTQTGSTCFMGEPGASRVCVLEYSCVCVCSGTYAYVCTGVSIC